MARGDRRRRYLAFAADGPAPPDPRAVEHVVLGVLERRLAREDLARVPPRVYPLRPGLGAVRVAHTSAAEARAALGGLRVGDATLRTVTTSGTLRQAKAALGIRTPKRPKRRPPAVSRAARTRSGPPRTLK